MKECFDLETNRLLLDTVGGIKYDLQLRGVKTIVNGDSATGKTLLCDSIQKLMEDDNVEVPYDVSDIFILHRYNREDLVKQSNKLVIIDRAERQLTSELIEHINSDRGFNHYLIFLRKPIGICLSPNYFAHFKMQQDVVTLEYQYNVEGWF